MNEFENADVVQSTVRVTRAGDGLSEALTVDPVEYRIGETVHVVLKCKVGAITLKPVKDTEVLQRVHTFTAQEGTVVAGELVEAALDAQRVAIEQSKGVHRLPITPEQ